MENKKKSDGSLNRGFTHCAEHGLVLANDACMICIDKAHDTEAFAT